jgi:hypothetical protein
MAARCWGRVTSGCRPTQQGDAGGHKGPLPASSPPPPLRMVMGFFFSRCLCGTRKGRHYAQASEVEHCR